MSSRASLPKKPVESGRRHPEKGRANVRRIAIGGFTLPRGVLGLEILECVPDLARPFRAFTSGDQGPGTLSRAFLELPRWGAVEALHELPHGVVAESPKSRLQGG